MPCKSRPRVLASGALEIPLGRRTALHIEPWSRGLCLSLMQGGRARSCWFSRLPLLVPPIENAPDRRVRDFVDQIPPDVRRAARRYPGFGQLALLHWACRWPQAWDLLFSNAGLLWLLTVCVYEHGIEQKEVQTLLTRKQRVILGRILSVRVATGAQLKLQRKTDFAEAGLREARVFRRAMSDAIGTDVLRHQQIVPVALFSLLVRYPELGRHPSGSPLIDVTRKISCRDVQIGLEYTNAMVARQIDALCLSQNADGTAASVIAEENASCLVDVQPDRDQFDRAERLDPKCVSDVFPPPPLPDSETITAIRSRPELKAESREMSHCVKDYAEDVWAGGRYFYRVLQPQRATVEIRIRKNGGLALGDCRLARNKKPSKATVTSIHNWLAQYNA